MLRFHRVRVLRRWPHPERGFTQGLLVEDGTVLESTGLYAKSALVAYRLGDAGADRRVPLAADLFGESICRVGDRLWQLTWREQVALRWDLATLRLESSVPFSGVGWGICQVRGKVLTSDGSNVLTWRDPVTLAPLATVAVCCDGVPVPMLDDLSWAGGRVWANVLGRPCLIGIDALTGEIADVVDAREIWEHHEGHPEWVLNGVAALPGDSELVLTGKRWHFLYHVALVPAGRLTEPLSLLTGGRWWPPGRSPAGDGRRAVVAAGSAG